MLTKQLRLFALIIICMFFAQIASSQVEVSTVFGGWFNSEKIDFEASVGANYSEILNISSTANQVGLNFGITCTYKFSKYIHLNSALYFSYPMGTNGLDIYPSPDTNINNLLDDAHLDRNISSFSMPILLRFRIFGNTFVESGPQVSYMAKVEDVFTINVLEDGDLTYKVKLEDKYTKFDFGWTAGITHQLREENSVSISLRYYYGLLDISKDPEYPDQHNSVFYFTVGIPIGNKSKEPKE